MQNILRLFPILAAFAVPLFAFAQGAFDTVINTLTDGINLIIVFLFLVATFVFLWGVVRYIAAGGDEDKVGEARNMIIWGIIFLAVMVAVWGFVNIVLDFIFNDENTVPIPDAGSGVPQQGGSGGP
jgi:hypothetical protein